MPKDEVRPINLDTGKKVTLAKGDVIPAYFPRVIASGEEFCVPADHGVVVPGPIKNEGKITNSGKITVI